MIVAETAEAYRFVTQPDHAALAGQFADHWGNEAFGRPEPSPSVAVAAHTHDDGWWTYDRRPHLGDDGTPQTFTELPAETWIDLYDEGIEAVIALDRYAGLLVSMHGTGLRRRRYELSPSWADTPPAFADFVERQERRQREIGRELLETDPHDRVTDGDVALLVALHETGSPPAEFASRLWRNYALLQAWDTLSLSLCTTVSPPSYPEIDVVPTSQDGAAVTLRVGSLGDGSLRVDPYPFDVDPLVVSVPTRTVPKDAFDDEESLTRAFYGAARETERFALRSIGQ